MALTLLIGGGAIAKTVAWRNHSPARIMLRGLAPDTTTRQLGDVAADRKATFAITLRNTTDQPIRIQDTLASGTCTVVEGIPQVIPAGGTTAIATAVQTSKQPGPCFGSLVLSTDSDDEPKVHLDDSGRVVAAPR